MDWTELEKLISEHVGEAFTIDNKQALGGGCINEAYRIAGSGQTYFVKVNQASRLDMFEAEYEGLDAMYQSRSIRVPRPLLSSISGSSALLVMEYIPLQGNGNAQAMGTRLAQMHGSTAEQFGWYRDNTIGATAQINDWADNWVEFWRSHRLGYQTRLAADKGIGRHAVRLCEQLAARLEDFFTDYQPQPSLLHGDLWGGNAAYDDNGEPVIFDPACYYGDREADLAMTELFSGFGKEFYASYNEAWPLDPGYKTRKTLYNQYHILNHYNLFGGSYASQAVRMAEQLLSECR
jgi:fructosamine-3-kinase